MIRKDMELVGTYNEIFEPTIKHLAKTERELSRAEKEWKKQGGQRICTMVNKTGAEYTAKSPYWTAVEDLRATVQSLRNQLGLTPTGLNKARSKLQPTAAGNSKIEQLLAAAHDHAVEQGAQYQRDVDAFVESVLSGESGLCEDVVLSCKRYVADLGSGKWDFRAEPANDIIAIIETMFCHQQGEFLDATPLRGTHFLLLPYHKFIVYNLMGFYLPNTKIRRFKEAVDFIPRKNVKTTFAASLAGALAMYERASGSKVYEVGGALKQALEGFDFLKYNFNRLGVTVKDDPNQGLRIIDNNMERSISGDIGDGMISINALAANPDKQDSFNCNIVIADEAHTYKNPQQYQILKDATKAYTNKLVIIISSNGPNARGFLLGHLDYCRKILRGTVTGNAADSIFCFLCSAPTLENGDVDLHDPAVLKAASPGWGYSIRPQDMIVKSVGNKSGNKIFIIQSIDRKMDFEDIARAKNLDFDELLTEIEGIVNSGTRLDISYYIDEFMDEDKAEDIYLYFKEDAESDSLDDAVEELGGDYTEEEIRLVRIKFMCEQGN